MTFFFLFLESRFDFTWKSFEDHSDENPLKKKKKEEKYFNTLFPNILIQHAKS